MTGGFLGAILVPLAASVLGSIVSGIFGYGTRRKKMARVEPGLLDSLRQPLPMNRTVRAINSLDEDMRAILQRTVPRRQTEIV